MRHLGLKLDGFERETENRRRREEGGGEAPARPGEGRANDGVQIKDKKSNSQNSQAINFLHEAENLSISAGLQGAGSERLPACLPACERASEDSDGRSSFITARNNRPPTKDAFHVCIIWRRRLKMAPQQWQLDSPGAAAPICFTAPLPKRRKRKKRGVGGGTQTLLIQHYFLPLLDFLPPIISLFQICNLLFIFLFSFLFFFPFWARTLARVLLAAARCTLLKCTFSPNHSSKGITTHRGKPQPPEITGRPRPAR